MIERAERLVDELSTTADPQRVAEALSKHGGDYPLLREVGVRLNLAERTAPAVELLQRAVRLTPDCARSHGHLGMALLKEHRPAEGEFHLREAIRLEPAWSTPRFELGRLLGDRGEREEAESLLRSAHELDPDWHLPAFHLALLIAPSGDRREVLRLLRKVTQRRPTWEGGWQQLATELHRQRRFGEAAAALDELFGLRPNWRWAVHNFELLGYPREFGELVDEGADPAFFIGLRLYRDGAFTDAAAVLTEVAQRAEEAELVELTRLYTLLARQCTHPALTFGPLMDRLDHDGFFFVQLGAMDGRSFDPIFERVRARGWRGLLVEPIPEHFARLRENYREHGGLAFENVAVGRTCGHTTIFGIPDEVVVREGLPDFCRGMYSMRPAQTSLVEYQDHVRSFTIRQLTLAELLERHGVESIDLLQIDVEGMDYEVLRQLDSTGVMPQLINLEFVNLPRAEKVAAMEWLRDHRYLYRAGKEDLLAIFMDSLPRVLHPEHSELSADVGSE